MHLIALGINFLMMCLVIGRNPTISTIIYSYITIIKSSVLLSQVDNLCSASDLTSQKEEI